MSQIDRTREHLIETYRKKAKHYDITSRLYPAPGYPQRAQRLKAVRALGRRAGDSVIDIACGTGLNFRLLEKVVGPGGRIVGVDLTDAMLARAQDRIATNSWRNVSLVQADAVSFDFPADVDAILSTYAMTQVPECAEVIAHGAKALSGGGRWVVLDLKVPGNTPGWLAKLGTAIVRPFASMRPWARASIASVKSTPTIRPPGPITFSISGKFRPVPHAMSITLSPARRPSACTARRRCARWG